MKIHIFKIKVCVVKNYYNKESKKIKKNFQSKFILKQIRYDRETV